MKKIILPAIILAVVFSFSGCGRRNEENMQPSETTQPITVPTLPDATLPSSNIPDPSVESNSTMPNQDETTTTTTAPAEESTNP